MTTFADLPDAARAEILATAKADIRHFAYGDEPTPELVEGLARSSRRHPDTHEDGPEVSLQVADAMDEIAQTMRLGVPVMAGGRPRLAAA